MATDDRCVVHFAVRARPGQPGIPSTPLGGAVSELPAVLAAAIKEPGSASVFACTPTLAPGRQHVMTDQPGLVNCKLCRRTQAWIDAPELGPIPKDPSKPPLGAVEAFLEEKAVVAEAEAVIRERKRQTITAADVGQVSG